MPDKNGNTIIDIKNRNENSDNTAKAAFRLSLINEANPCLSFNAYIPSKRAVKNPAIIKRVNTLNATITLNIPSSTIILITCF